MTETPTTKQIKIQFRLIWLVEAKHFKKALNFGRRI
jgi:hypothetical protein